MKKTLFLSAILATALCSSAFAETITVDGQTYNDVTIVTTATLDATPTSKYILIGGTTSTDNGQANYKVTPDSQDSSKIKGAWVTSLSSAQTLIIAPASTVVSEGSPVNYAGYQTFFDTSNGAAQTVNANIIVGGNDSVNLLRFWGGNSFTLNGDLTLVGNGVNVWNQSATHKLTGKLIASEGQTLKQTSTSGGTLNLAQANLSEFNGTIAVNGGYVKMSAAMNNMELGSGTTAKFSGGKVTTGSHLVLTQGDAKYGIMSILADGAERITASKASNQLTLQAGSEKTIASMTTTGNNGGWLVVEGVGDTTNGLYTDIILNSTSNGLISGVSGATAHIGSLSGTAASAQVRGDWNTGTNRVIAVHQNTDTTFAGQFIYKDDQRDVALVKYGTGTLTLTGDNATTKALTLNEGGVTFSGSGHWAGAINVDGGVLTFASALADSARFGAVTVGANGSIKFNTSQYAANAAKFSSLTQDGTLILTGSTGADGIDLSTAWSGSTIALNAVSGKLLGSATGTTTISQDIHLTNTTSAAAEWSTVEGASYVFNGAITDDATMHGNMVFGANKETNVTFNGSLAGWNSTVNNYSGFRVSNGTVNLTIGGDVTGDDAVVSNTITVDSVSKPDSTNRKGTLKMTVARDAQFTGRIYANTLTVNAGMTVSATNTNVEVQDAISLGDGASLTISAAGAQTTGALTLGSGSTLTLGSAASHNNNLTTSTLTVEGDASMNANLVVNSGTLTFAEGAVLTMGCDVTISGSTVYVTIDSTFDDFMAGLRAGNIDLVVIDGLNSEDEVKALTLNGLYVTDSTGAQYTNNELGLKVVENSLTSNGAYCIVVAPEPATATLSLLALAALAARRKRH